MNPYLAAPKLSRCGQLAHEERPHSTSDPGNAGQGCCWINRKPPKGQGGSLSMEVRSK